MGKIASTFSDHIILTDDNPRNEKPMKIINDAKGNYVNIIAEHRIP